jgi:hypothetical protein
MLIVLFLFKSDLSESGLRKLTVALALISSRRTEGTGELKLTYFMSQSLAVRRGSCGATWKQG